MRIPCDPEIIKWIDTRAKPWKPKDDAPEDMAEKVREYLKKMDDFAKKHGYE